MKLTKKHYYMIGGAGLLFLLTKKNAGPQPFPDDGTLPAGGDSSTPASASSSSASASSSPRPRKRKTSSPVEESSSSSSSSSAPNSGAPRRNTPSQEGSTRSVVVAYEKTARVEALKELDRFVSAPYFANSRKAAEAAIGQYKFYLGGKDGSVKFERLLNQLADLNVSFGPEFEPSVIAASIAAGEANLLALNDSIASQKRMMATGDVSHEEWDAIKTVVEGLTAQRDSMAKSVNLLKVQQENRKTAGELRKALQGLASE